MRAGNRTEGENQRNERRAGCRGIGKQSQRNISAGKPLRHDPRTENGGHEKRSPEKFRCGAPRERTFHWCPMPSISFWMASWPRVERGKDIKRLILRSRIMNALRNARSISSGVPCAAAGSGTPQWAVMGWPGHTGQISLAALSQTVKTKFICGAPGFANSSQLLLRKSSVDIRESSICLSASGRTWPAGWLPALNAENVGRPFRLRIASAMIERAEFPVQRKST